jgi:sugar phosphate isomerase/epimerase
LWAKGVSIRQPEPAEDNLRKAIQAAESLGAGVLLAAAFDKNCPDMQDESSYGPVVSVLEKVAPAAEAAGVTVCMETSLSPEDDKKLIDLVNRPGVKVYYDAENCERFGHKGQGVAGYATLGKARLGQVHLKNENRLLEEPGRVDWAAALKALKKTGYEGWMVFESSHSGPEQCIEATTKIIDFIRRHFT